METLTSKVDGNREPSRWYTSGRCRDYLGASVHLITGESVPRPTSKAGGDDIVHAPVKAGNQSYNISPETTPFISNMSNRRDVKNTYFEWQTSVQRSECQ